MSAFALGASFYGDGFVHLKTAVSSNYTSLHIRFRTSSSDGLLFLAAGQTDYLLVELRSGLLQVTLDLGSGERVLHSERGSPLNDLAWHTVELQHEHQKVRLTVDKRSQTGLEMHGPEEELSAEGGLYVGGAGDLEKPYLPGNRTGFRGCIDEAVFNQHTLLVSLKPYPGLRSIHEVHPGCSQQFSASADDPISFFSSRAFIALPSWNGQPEGFECLVRTAAEEGIILYSSSRQGDSVAMEMRKGLVVAVVVKGETRMELRPRALVSDRKWHSVRVLFTKNSLQVTVDEETVQTSMGSPSSPLNLRGYLYVGGVDDDVRIEVRKMGLVSVSGKRAKGGSLKACLKNITINGVHMGLQDAVLTKDISVGCEPEKELESRVTPVHKYSLAKGNFLLLRDLLVPEGSHAALESKHIKVNLEFERLGIIQSQILFRIREQPLQGEIRLDVDPGREENTFSMLDLWRGRVIYIHSGSEDLTDFFMFSVLTSRSRSVPAYLNGDMIHRFNITIMPTNDAPELSLPEGNLFVLLENSKKLLTTDVLKATDIDSNSTDLVFSVIGSPGEDTGSLEIDGHLSKAFSYSDLEEGRVSYVHTGVRKSGKMEFKVSDGDKVSNTVVLRIMVLRLEYKIANNTGLEVTQGGTALIGTRHLAVWTNAVNQMVDIRYDVIEPPQFGELQRLHTSGEWKPVSTFSQRLLEKERLKYVSTFRQIQTGNITDHFKCKVRVGSTATNELVFPITVKWIQYKLTRNETMEVSKVRRVALSSQYLYVTVEGVELSEDELHFRLQTVPKKGNLLLNDMVLKKNSVFSQRSVADKQVQYELADQPRKDTTDMFTFQVFSKHASSASYDFRIAIKVDTDRILIINNGLSVMEGEGRLISKDELYSETLSAKSVFYTIKNHPKHGKLKYSNLSNSTSGRDNVLVFTNQDILEKCIMYVHDDSETIHDQFSFLASVGEASDRITMEGGNGTVEGTFIISVQPVNDEKPVRVVDKVFHVVREGRRLLTLEDLRYHDADSDFSDSWLVYTRRAIPMGELVMANDTSHKLYRFRQEDLERKRVLFIHRGVSSGRFVLLVSDGRHHVSTLLDVRASDPYLRIGNSTDLLVRKGQATAFNSSTFSVVTNMDVRDDREITYKVSAPPRHGVLYRGDEVVASFTQGDLKMGHLSYHHHDDSSNLRDSFSFTVRVKDMRLDTGVNVTVYLGSQQQLPDDIRNNTLMVDEGQPGKINKTKMELPPPHCDHIEYSHFPVPLTALTRRQAEQEFTHYVQDSSETLEECFTGIANDSDLQKQNQSRVAYVQVAVVNTEPPVITANRILKVWEGSVTEICPDDLGARDEDTPPEGLEFVVTPPSNGHLALKSAPSWPVLNFTQAHIDQGQLLFVHSGALSGGCMFQVTDGVNFAPIQIFTVKARPLVLTLERNRPLQVFPGSSVLISAEHLLAVTNDDGVKGNHTVLFSVIRPPKLGKLVKVDADNCTAEISSFTQSMVNESMVAYEHTHNESLGQVASDVFTFTVTSPPASLETETFQIRIVYENARAEREYPLLANSGAVVIEGERVTIDKSKLDASNLLEELPKLQQDSYEVWYWVKLLPQHGVIIAGEQNLTNQKPSFSQSVLTKEGIIYLHDNSETNHDSFVFRAWLKLKSRPDQRPLEDSKAVEASFNITVVPVNDQPPELKTLAPSLSVERGGRVALGPENLNVVDLDNPPEDIKYTLIRKPNNGFLALEGSLNGSVVAFTQAQINRGKVYFIQGGSLISGNFYLSVTDGHHQPVYTEFNVEVTENETGNSLVKKPNLTLEQGQTSAVLTHEHLTAATSGKDTTIHYQVTKPPRYGNLLIDNNIVTQFDHTDLQLGKLSYHMVDLSSSHDSFELTSFVSEGNGTRQVVNITVKPFIRIAEDARLPNGIAVKLGTDLLDATELSTLSGSDPHFEVLSSPKPGKMVQILTVKDGVSQPVTSFSFQDVEQGRVAIVATVNTTIDQELNDSLGFVLKADNVQPARGELLFTIVPQHQVQIKSVQTPRHTQAEEDLLDTPSNSQSSHKTLESTNGQIHMGIRKQNNSSLQTVPRPTSGKRDIFQRSTPVGVESFSTQASNTLLIILPVMAVLFLIVIIVVLTLVSCYHGDKQSLSSGTDSGQPEVSAALPSVTVTPLAPGYQGSPVQEKPDQETLAPMVGPHDPCLMLCALPISNQAVQQLATSPTLQHNQYWV
ncbi:chondroitin sulfate proteoglycan 4 [Megalops cyprinoides]|uniref:chondroitin sulfate proteoglycan 4 n=1 Tax=Megalops cyprinoides TaxID=118141 RepID=UPI001863E5E1|nr:chondroitin sulfate proteoglycan 4 [Megalops cyprinoides]